MACLAAACALPSLRAEPAAEPLSPSLPATVFSPSDDIQYLQACGVLGDGGFAADVELTYYYRDTGPFRSAGATQDEIAAVRGKTLIRESDWQRFERLLGEQDPALLRRFRVSEGRYLIGGVPYLAVTYSRGDSNA